MRKLLLVLGIFLLAFNALAQTSNPSEFTVYNGQEYMPRLFEPYRAEYVFKGKGLGLTFSLFEFSTRIIERQDHWEEEISFRLAGTFQDKIEDFPEAIFISSDIDLKTGLLQRMKGETRMPTGENVKFLAEIGGGKIVSQGWVNGKLEETKAQPFSENVYPCLSFTFSSYLPLKEGFAGEFKCLGADDKDNLQLYKRFVKVVGSETITMDAGTFDCFKLQDEGEMITTVKGKKMNPNYRDKYGVVQYFSGLRSYSWVDKKTRKLVKAELDFKKSGAKLTLELKPAQGNRLC